ncbi:transporter substrate-binding domain-containing protein [Christensenellaceae bacterium OttesenSCG-928-M15]|nr:transporter substrate-binding domain-containing protein [Christensenellaceae bacterium OttesenSCG-928-M15]
MKKYLAIMLAVAMLVGLAACGSSPAPAPDPTPGGEAPQTSDAPANQGTAPTDSAPEVRNIVYGFPGTAARFNFQNDDGTFDGYEIAIVAELDKRLENYTFELYCAGEFSALTPGLDSKKFNMVGSNITWKQERAENYLYSDVAYFHSPITLFVRGDDTSVNSIDDLKGKELLTITGTAQALFLEAYNEQHTDNPIKLSYIDASSLDVMAQVVSGRYDACIHPRVDGSVAKDERGYDLRPIAIENAESIAMPDAFFLFAKGDEKLQQDVDATLRDMKADGTLSKLCADYFGEDLVPAE